MNYRLVILCVGFCSLSCSCESLFRIGVGLAVKGETADNQVLWSQTTKLYSPKGLIQTVDIKENIVSVFGHVFKKMDGTTHLAQAAIDIEFQKAPPLPNKLVVLRGKKVVRGGKISLKNCIWFDPKSGYSGSSFETHAIKVIKQRNLKAYSLDDWSLDQKLGQ